MIDLVASVIEDMQANGEEIPAPLAEQIFRAIMVRTTPKVHRQLVMRSSKAGVSLNRYVNSCLLG